ncbi:MAG: helix-turn-helix domain-containing protein [Sphaerochaeta sp.]|jgi:transcriptional regulator with XRE-family HTH domain|nr:helix-turn-helix domain-containing protein [Sphaerochaeta sp.]
MTVNERIKTVRKRLKYNQADFGKRIAVAQNYLSNIEVGQREATSKIVKLICKEFGVNEEWLREGKGEMFINESELLVTLGSRYDTLDDMDKRILLEYIKLKPSQRKVMREFIRRVANEES